MNEVLKTVFSSQARKAWGSGIVTFFTALQLAIGEGGTLSDVTQYEWLGVVIATFGAFGATYSLSNGDKPFTMDDYIPLSDDKRVAPLSDVLRLESEVAWLTRQLNQVDKPSSAPATMNTVKASDV